jgi:hypothetical protein
MDLSTTMIYTHSCDRPRLSIRSRLTNTNRLAKAVLGEKLFVFKDERSYTSR